MRHREVDLAHPAFLGPRADAAAQAHGGLRTADDLDVLPGECARDAEAERLTDRFLAGEPARVALGRVGTRLAIGLLGCREAALAEACVPLERPPDPRDLDQVG